MSKIIKGSNVKPKFSCLGELSEAGPNADQVVSVNRNCMPQ